MKPTSYGNDQRDRHNSQHHSDLNTVMDSVVYKGSPVFFFISPVFIAVLVICEWFNSALAACDSAAGILFEQYFLRQIESFVKSYKKTADEYKRYHRFEASELVGFIMEYVLPDIRRIARNTFFKVLSWYSIDNVGDIPKRAAGYCFDVIEFITGSLDGIPDDIVGESRWWYEFYKHPGVKGLNAVKAFSRASGAAAVDVSNYLSDTVPRLIVAFSKERFGRNIGVTAVLKNIENTAVGEPLSDERRTNVERRLLDLITKDEEDNENGNAIIAAFLERKKFCRFRATLSMACRTYTSDVCGLNKDTMHDNLCRHQKIEGFLKLLEESGMTVAQMFDYAIAGAEKYFGLYVHEKLRSQTMAALKECAEDKAVDVLRAAAGSADSKVLCEYIQHSNSKVNLEINRKIPGTTH